VLIDDADLAALGALNLANADGTPFDPEDKTDLVSRLTCDSNAETISNQLSRQLAAMTLNVRPFMVAAGAEVTTQNPEGTVQIVTID